MQDLGVASLIRRNFPRLELPASTQLAVHSLAGVATLRQLGFSRVVLARELTLAEIGDIKRFNNPDKLLAYAGLSPTTYQSGQFQSTHAHMEKRGSKYLRYALFNAAKYVCIWDPEFKSYLAKKRAEGKHYNVAVSHAVKKLVRLIYAMEKSGKPYAAKG